MRKGFSSLWFFIVVAVSYWAVAPLLVPGFFPMHDATQVARVYEMARGLLDGMFPVRWVVDLGYGYGYPIFSFYGPFAYYIGAIPVILGTNALVATKIMFGVGIILSGIGMFYLARTFWGNAAAVVSSLLYIYAPYHAVTVYVRGAVGEFFGYALLPFVFYGAIKMYKVGAFRYFVVFVLSYAALILSHNLTALMITPYLLFSLVVLAFFSLKEKKVKSFYFLLFGLLLGLGVSAFYWLPAFLEMQYTNVFSQVGGGANFRDHFVCLAQLWSSQWGFAGSARGCIDGLSFQIGKLHILFVFLTIPLFVILFGTQKERAFVLGTGMVFFLLSIFLLLPYSRFLWELAPQIWFIQYPWRFLMFVSFFSSFIAGGVIWYIFTREAVWNNRVFRVCVLGSVSVVILLLYTKLFIPQAILNKSSNDYTNINELRWKTSKISDEYLPTDFSKPYAENEFPLNTFYVLSGDAKPFNEMTKAQEYSVEYRSFFPSTIGARIAHFPAWVAYLDDNLIPYEGEGNGYSVEVPSGRHQLKFSYHNTPIEEASNILSVISILILLTGIILTERKGQL
ncbi:MAG: 6-pyruvoyl-tetrahydropterin synthase-related protein [bacterium]|nr:6-pyruvoyl-tetrahydropterin synthase-related protein [bacterium]